MPAFIEVNFEDLFDITSSLYAKGFSFHLPSDYVSIWQISFPQNRITFSQQYIVFLI